MLRAQNLLMAALHAVQGVIVLVLSNDFSLPVTEAFLDGPPGTTPPVPEIIVDVRLAWGVAGFFFLSALFHLIVTTPWFHGRYRRGLDAHRNHFRWVEYSMSASLMVVLIAMLTGITDVAALTALVGVNASMIFFGALQEKYEEPGGSLTPFWLGCIAGTVPWIAIAIYLVSPGTSTEPPGFVYAIFLSLFLFFNVFAVNQLLQYRRVGPWRDYLFGERVYILLSLTAKSALAWQVFAGALAG